MRNSIYILPLLLLLYCCSGNTETTKPLEYDSQAYHHVNIIDGTGGECQKDMTIIVKNGFIDKIGSSDNVKIPESAEVINCKNRWVIPGLIDMHAHVTVLPVDSNLRVIEKYDTTASHEALRTMLSFGITTVRNPAAPTEDGIKLRGLIDSKEIIGPTIYTTGAALNRTKASFGPFSATSTEKEIREEVRNQVNAGVNYIKVYGSLKKEQVAIAIDEAHKNGVKVIGHLQNTSWTDAANSGIDFITHAAPWNGEYLNKEDQKNYVPSFLGRLFWLDNVDYNGPQIKEMIDAMKKNSVSVDPTLIAFHTKFWGDDDMYTSSENLQYAPDMCVDIWNKTTFVSNWSDSDFKKAKKQWNKLLELTKIMHDEGIMLTAGSDFPNPWVVPGVSIHQEMKLLCDSGIKESEVIQIATLNGAKALEIEEETGSIEVGKFADMVFLSENPLVNIENTMKVEFILKKGIRYSSYLEK